MADRLNYTFTVGAVHTLALKQRHGKDPHVAAFNMDVAEPNGAPVEGRYLRDEGNYFAIRFRGIGIAVYQRDGGPDAHGNMRDRGILVIIL